MEEQIVSYRCIRDALGEETDTYKIENIPYDEPAENLFEYISIVIGELTGEEKNFKPEYSIENDGIGSYEYWGMRGFDKGTDYVVIEGNTAGSPEIKVQIDIAKIQEDPVTFARRFNTCLPETHKSFWFGDDIKGMDVEASIHPYDVMIDVMEKSLVLILRLEWCNCSQ